MRSRLFVVGVAALVALFVAPFAGAGAVTAVPAASPAVPGTQLWVSRYNGPGNGIDQGPRVGVSRSGNRVFVSGTSFGSVGSGSISTVAYNAANGRRLWADVYPEAYAESLALSPDGSRVFVTGYLTGGDDYVTIAYSAVNGRRLWVSRYNGPGNGSDIPQSLAVSPDGTKLFVTGYTAPNSASSVSAYSTVAYVTANGAQLWAKAFSGSGGIPNQAFSVAVSPDGTKVFVTGSLYDLGAFDYGTVAYNAATGTQLWVSRYTGGSGSFDSARRVVVSPDGSKVFVTGRSGPFYFGAPSNDYATVAYNTANGAQLWVSRYNGPANGDDSVNDVAVSSDGTKLFVTGSSEYDTSVYPAPRSAATVAYNTANGAQLWVSRYNGPAVGATAQSVGVSLDGTKVFITGTSYAGATGGDYATVAYNAANGAQEWTALYNGPGNNGDSATSLVVSPRGTKLFVTGSSYGVGSSTDFATIAYSVS